MFSRFVLLLCLLVPVLASITPLSTTSSTMLSFGSAYTVQTYLLKASSSEEISSINVDAPTRGYRAVLSNYSTGYTQVGKGVYNITLEMVFESWLGNLDYAVLVETISANGVTNKYSYVDTHNVYGVVVHDENRIVSGDEARGVEFEHFLRPDDEGMSVKVFAYGPEGVDMTPEFESSGILKMESVVLRNGMVHIRPRDFSSGYAMVEIVCAGLEIDGEMYETVLPVSVSEKPKPPVVLVKVNASFADGVTKIEGEVWNGGNDVSLIVDGKKFQGVMSGEEKYVFEGEMEEGVHEDVRIVRDGEDGIVKDGVVIEILGMRKMNDEEVVEGEGVNVGIVVSCVIVIGMMLILTGIGLMIHRRNVKLQSVFIDGRPEHIARDVYGRGSLHV